MGMVTSLCRAVFDNQDDVVLICLKHQHNPYIYIPETHCLASVRPLNHSITTSSSLVIKSLNSACLSSLCCTIRALQYRRLQQSSNHISSLDSMSSSGSSDSSSNPSMLHGHAAYVAAAAKVCISTCVPASACRLWHLESSTAVAFHHEIIA